MASLTITIKFRGVTVEDMTVEEARELRDLLDGIVGKRAEIMPVPYPVWPTYPHYWQPTWYLTGTGAMDCGSLTSVTADNVTLTAK